MRFETRLKPCYNLIDLTPLVDVIFLMLIFFLVSSDTLPLKSLQILHPEMDLEEPAKLCQLPVIMDKDHVIYVGSKKEIVDLSSVQEALLKVTSSMTAQPEFKPTVVLSIDKRVEYDAFLKLFSEVIKVTPHVRLAFKTNEGMIQANANKASIDRASTDSE